MLRVGGLTGLWVLLVFGSSNSWLDLQRADGDPGFDLFATGVLFLCGRVQWSEHLVTWCHWLLFVFCWRSSDVDGCCGWGWLGVRGQAIW